MSEFNIYPRPDERLKDQKPVYNVGKFLLTETVNSCTCYGGGPYGHEPGCGEEPIDSIDSMVEFATVASKAIREAHMAIVAEEGDPVAIIREAYDKLYPNNPDDIPSFPEGDLF